MWHAESTVRWACNAALKKGTKTRIVLTKSFSNCNRHCVMQTACKNKKKKKEKKKRKNSFLVTNQSEKITSVGI